ncbi:MAG: hypothetical protein WA581_13715 [Candidatus Acidiferrales bacterium]
MDLNKKQQLAELRKDRTRVIAGLREQLNSLKAPDDLKTLLAALVGLSETQDLLDRWERWEENNNETKAT